MRFLVVLLALCLFLPALAEDPPNPQAAVLDPTSGQVLGHYLLMMSMQERIEAGSEEPHFEYLKEFCFSPGVDPGKLTDEQGRPYSRPDRIDDQASLGYLPNGDRLVWYRTKGSHGPVKVMSRDGRQRVLLESRELGAPGWRPLLRPGACVAGPYLLSEEPDGASCRLVSDGSTRWKAPWKFGHCRWNLGAWYQGGALYVDTEKGLARVDPKTGKIAWIWPDAVELLRVRIYPDGLLYVDFQYGPHPEVFKSLRAAAKARYHWDDDQFGVRAIPYKATYFGRTWRGEKYLQDGKVAIWERLEGKWKFIFEYSCQGQSEAELDELYARHQFSPGMRRQLTTDSTATVYRGRDGKRTF
ncbi:MAG: hypothetical protein AB7S38_23075 [Vulcanimicrobiota bacterium]